MTGGAGLKVGLVDPRGLFHPKRFHDSLIFSGFLCKLNFLNQVENN